MEPIKPFQKTQFTKESDEDLLVIMSIKEDLQASNQAFNEFYRRFYHFTYGMLVKVTSKLPNPEELRDSVFQNTMISVYKYCNTFSTRGEKDPKRIRRMIHGWLIKIAKKELFALLENREKIVDPKELDFHIKQIDEDEIDSEADPPSYDEQIVEEAFQLLSERDRHIFKTYWLYYEKGNGDQARNLPPDVLNDLAAKYETTPMNIRKIIERAKKKVYNYLRQNYRKDRR